MAILVCPGPGCTAQFDTDQLPHLGPDIPGGDRMKPTVWWCLRCLGQKVHAARHDLGMCHCAEQPAPHEHREVA